MEAVYIELRQHEMDIGVIKDEIERERSRDDGDQTKIQRLEADLKQRKELYFANQERYRDLNFDVKNQVERIRAILASEKPLGDRLRRVIQEGGCDHSFYNYSNRIDYFNNSISCN